MASGPGGPEDTSSLATGSDTIENRLGDSLLTKARDLFAECDWLDKGYITRSDMSGLEGLLPLTVEELEHVFDVLDENRVNRLTLDEFTDGFGMFLGIAANRFHSKKMRKLQMTDGRPLSPINEQNDPYEDFLDQIGCRIMFKDVKNLRALFELLRKENLDLLPPFQDFLLRISEEFQDSELNSKNIEKAFQKCKNVQEEELKSLYLEMEERFKSENVALLAEEEFKNRRIKEKLQEELAIKNKLLVQIQLQQEEMQEKILRLKFEESARKKQNEMLKKEKEYLEKKLLTATREREKMEMQLKVTNQVVWQTRPKRHRGENNRLFDDNGYPDSDHFYANQSGIFEPISLCYNQSQINAHRKMLRNINCIEEFNRLRLSSDMFPGSLVDVIPTVSPFALSENNNSAETCGFSDQITWKVTSSQFQEDQSMSKPHWKVKMKIMPFKQKTVLLSQVNEQTSPEISVASDVCDGNFCPERIYKVIFVGDSGVGKTSFIHRFCNDNFRTNFATTVGMDFHIKTVFVNNQWVTLQCWDPAGQERFRCICKQYFRKADAAVIMYSVICKRSFLNIRQWLDSIKENAEDEVTLLLIGNKTDVLVQDVNRAVSWHHGYRLAMEYDALFYETSVKTGLNVNAAVRKVISLLQEKEDNDIENIMKLEDTPQKLKWRC